MDEDIDTSYYDNLISLMMLMSGFGFHEAVNNIRDELYRMEGPTGIVYKLNYESLKNE